MMPAPRQMINAGGRIPRQKNVALAVAVVGELGPERVEAQHHAALGDAGVPIRLNELVAVAHGHASEIRPGVLEDVQDHEVFVRPDRGVDVDRDAGRPLDPSGGAELALLEGVDRRARAELTEDPRPDGRPVHPLCDPSFKLVCEHIDRSIHDVVREAFAAVVAGSGNDMKARRGGDVAERLRARCQPDRREVHQRGAAGLAKAGDLAGRQGRIVVVEIRARMVEVARELIAVLQGWLGVGEMGALPWWLLPEAAKVEQQVLVRQGEAQLLGSDRSEHCGDLVGHAAER